MPITVNNPLTANMVAQFVAYQQSSRRKPVKTNICDMTTRKDKIKARLQAKLAARK